MAATAAFYYASHVVGSSGFQAGAAELDFLTRTRGMKLGFRIVNYADMLYPQYWEGEVVPTFEAYLADEDNSKRIAKEAVKLLAEGNEWTHLEVKAHWEWIAGSRVGVRP